MKKFTQHILVYILLLLPVLAFAQPSEAEFINYTKEYTLNADGSMDLRVYKQLKLNTILSFDRLYGETFIVYNPQVQKITIKDSYTKQKDGNVVKTPANAFNEVLPSFAANAPAFNHLREMVVTHTGTEVGATIYLDYTLHTNAGYYAYMEGSEVLQEDSPIHEYVILVKVPADKQLQYHSFNTVQPKVSKSGDYTEYRWVVKNIPASAKESFQSPADLKRVVFTTSTSNIRAFSEYAKQFKYSSSDVLRKQVNAVIGDEANDWRKIAKVGQFISNNIATANVPPYYAGYTCRDVETILETAYATPAEKALLMANMLRFAKIAASPAAIVPAFLANAPVGLSNIDGFNVLLDFGQDDVKYYYSPQRNTLDYAERAYYVMGFDNALLNQSKSAESSVKYTSDMVINASLEAKADLQAELRGAYSPYFAMLSDNSNGTSMLRQAGKVDDAKFVQNTPDYVKVKCTATRTLSNKNGYVMFNLPAVLPGVDSWNMTMLSSERKTSLQLPYAADELYTYQITVPAGYSIENKNQSVKIDNAVGKVEIALQQTGDKLTVTRSIQFKKTMLDKAAYQDFRKLMNAWNTQTNRMIVLKKAN